MNFEQIMLLVENKEYVELKKVLLEQKAPDIAEIIDELDPRNSLLVFRLLPKELAVDVFAFLVQKAKDRFEISEEKNY